MTDDPHCPFTIPVSSFARQLGIACERVEPDRAVYALPFRTDHVTVADVVHGGAIASLLDVAATGAAWTTVSEPAQHRGVTIDLSVSFVAAARGTTLIADARVVRRGGTVCFVDVDVRGRPGNELVARGKVVYKLSRLDTPAEKMQALFSGRTTVEQMTLLATLERSGAALYRAFAETATDPAVRDALLEAARREVANAEVLEATLRR